MSLFFLRKCLLGILFLGMSCPLAQAQENDMKTDVGITRGRNIHLWPIFYRDKTEEEKKLEVVASLFQYKKRFKDTVLHSHLFPLYVYDSARLKKDIRIGTLYYPSAFRYTHSTEMGVKSFKFLEVIPNIDLLEFTRSSQGDYLKNNLLFFLWFKNNRTEGNSHFVVFPIWWKYRNPYDKYTVFIPLFSHHAEVGTAIAHTWVFPSFYSINKKEEKKLGLWPLYFHKSDSVNKTNVLFPVFWSYKKAYQRSLSVFPLFIYGKNLLTQRSYVAFSPFIWNVSKPDYRFQAVLPLAWRKKETTEKRELSRAALFPLFYYKNNKELTIQSRYKKLGDSAHYFKDTLHTLSRNITLFPLLWDFKTEVLKDSVLYKSSRYLEIFPIFGKGTTYRSSDSASTSFVNISPLCWQIKNRIGTTRLLFPIWWYQKQLVSNGRAQKIAHVLFPLFWHHAIRYLQKDSVPRTSTVLFPMLWYLKRPDATYHAIIPFYFFTKNKKDSSSALALTPLFIRVHQKQTNNTILFLLFHAYRSPGSCYTTLLPLFSYQSDSSQRHTRLVVSPFFWKTKEDSVRRTVLFPVFRHEQDMVTKTTKDHIGLLLYRSVKTDSTRKQHIMWPFIGWGRTPKQTYFHFFPLVWRTKGRETLGGQRTSLGVTPLFWKTQAGSIRTTLLFPLFYRREDVATKAIRENMGIVLYRHTKKDSSENRQFIWPFVGYKKTPQQFSYHVAPLVWYQKKKEKKWLGVFPVYYSVKRENSQSHHLFWPLYTYKKMNGVYKAHALLGPFFRMVKMESGTHDVRLLHLLFAHSTLNGKVLKSYFPFYYHTRDTSGNFSTSVGLAFYTSFKRKIPGSDQFYKEKKVFWFIRFRSNLAYLKERGVVVDRKKIRRSM